MSIFPLGGCVIPSRTTLDKRGSFSVHLYQKDLKLVKKWLSCGIFPLRGCVTQSQTTWDKGGSLGVISYQKDLKLVKKWLSYGQEVA